MIEPKMMTKLYKNTAESNDVLYDFVDLVERGWAHHIVTDDLEFKEYITNKDVEFVGEYDVFKYT